MQASFLFRFRVYKFMGDGWILLFDFAPGENIVNFAEAFSLLFENKIQRLIKNHIDNPPDILGLTFGVDRGTLVKLNIMGREEYVGWPINVASRLEKARNGDKTPQYKLLVTKPVYQVIKQYLKNYPVKHVTRKLKNVQVKPFHCVSIRVKEL